VLRPEAFAHVQQGLAKAEEAAIEPAPVKAGHKRGSHHRQAHLAAVIVAGQDQLDAGRACAREKVRGVAQKDPEIGLGRGAEVEPTSPRHCRASQRDCRPGQLQAGPAALDVFIPRARKRVANLVSVE